MQILHTVALLRLIDSKIDLCVSFFLSLSFSICRITANWSSLMGPRVFISLISRHDWTIYHIVKLDRFIILLFVWRVNFPTCSNPIFIRILRNNIKWEFDRKIKRFIRIPILPVSCQCIIFERRSRWILSVIVHVNIYVTTTFDDISLAYASLRTRSQCISFPEMSFSK